MKYIIAMIKPAQLEAVREALTGVGIEGLTVSEVKGYGRQKGQTEIYRGAEYQIHYTPKVKIEVAVQDDQEESVINTIRETAHTGKIGDGKIFSMDLGKAVRIRTGEANDEAL